MNGGTGPSLPPARQFYTGTGDRTRSPVTPRWSRGKGSHRHQERERVMGAGLVQEVCPNAGKGTVLLRVMPSSARAPVVLAEIPSSTRRHLCQRCAQSRDRLTLRPCSRCNQACASSLHSLQSWVAATLGPEPAGASSSSFSSSSPRVSPGCYPRSMERRTSRGWERCSSGCCLHPQA